jgi:ABC-type branched-subunit amino acid transport system permease subunit
MQDTTPRRDLILFLAFAAAVLTMPLWTAPFGAAYPDLLQKFAIFGIFAIGFNILFGLTGYLSFGHAAFLGVGSYTAVWSFKLLSMNPLPAVLFGVLLAGLFSAAIGYVSLRRTGIYFAILTLAFAQMSYNLAYSVLTPLTNGETGLQLRGDDPRALDALFGVERASGLPTPSIFGVELLGYPAFYFCAIALIGAFYLAQRIARSPFGTMLRAIKSNQNRLSYTGVHTRPYALTAFVISGMYAGLAERMQWTASGEVVLMTILGGAGTLLGPFLGAVIIKYFENIFSSFNKGTLQAAFDFLPDWLTDPLVGVLGLFVGDGWHLTLGLVFMIIVIFLPGGLMEGVNRLTKLARRRRSKDPARDGSASDSSASDRARSARAYHPGE